MTYADRRRAALAAMAITLVPALAPSAALAQDITIDAPYARAASPIAKSGAAFMTIHNTGDSDDRLIDARSDIAKRVELHTHIDAGNGIMQMREDEDGFPVPAGGMAMLARGGDHVMFMGLNEGMQQGDTISVVLVFEKAGELRVEIPVDLTRKPNAGAMKHGTMKHGEMGMGKKAD